MTASGGAAAWRQHSIIVEILPYLQAAPMGAGPEGAPERPPAILPASGTLLKETGPAEAAARYYAPAAFGNKGMQEGGAKIKRDGAICLAGGAISPEHGAMPSWSGSTWRPIRLALPGHGAIWRH